MYRGFAGLLGLVLLWLAAPAASAQTIEFLPGAPSVYENGGAAGTNVTIIVTRAPATGNSSVNFSTVNGTATAGLDFIGTNFTVNFTNGESFQVISIPIIPESSDK